MPRADNSRFLADAAATRRHEALQRTQIALEHLDRTGQSVTFASVAAVAGVSRSWLYGQADIRRTIDALRSSAPVGTAAPPAASRASLASLKERLEAARHEIAQLRADNTALRDQLARHLGAERNKRGLTVVR
jgi:hypothetical protein